MAVNVLSGALDGAFYLVSGFLGLLVVLGLPVFLLGKYAFKWASPGKDTVKLIAALTVVLGALLAASRLADPQEKAQEPDTSIDNFLTEWDADQDVGGTCTHTDASGKTTAC
jgi:hypothetical protein